MFFKQALILAMDYKNVYLEPSWINILNVKAAIKSIGASRIMFSSDMPVNIPVELAKYKYATNNESDLEQILCGTAKEVFDLKI